MKKLIAIFSIATVFLFSLNGCFQQPQEETKEDTTKQEEQQEDTKDEVETDQPTAQAASFAEWQDNTVSFTPKVPSYTIEDDLSNVLYTDLIGGPKNAKTTIAENGFVVVPGWHNEFFTVYEDNRYEMNPSFITTDSVLHTYHLYFDFLLRSLEMKELFDLAYELSFDMQQASLKQYEELKGTEWEDAAKRNVAYFTIALELLDSGDEPVPEIVKTEVEQELVLIDAHQGIEESVVMGDTQYLEDYSQYIPRGHYTKNEQLKHYFRALMWYGRMTFRLSKEDESRSALLMMSALKNSDSMRNDWKRLYEPIGFFVGDADDLVYPDYEPVATDIYGEDLAIEELTSDSGKLSTFIEKAKDLRDPGVNSMPVLGTILTPDEGVEERTEKVKGFRFLGQRFTIDAYVFQKLICREVGNKDGTMPCPAADSRMLPKGLDIPSAMGSDLAYKLLDEMGETEYAKYPENMKKLQDGMAKLPLTQWTSNLYWGWIHTLNSLLSDYGDGYPMFMQNENWKKKELTTWLASWAELKRDTILYAKQVYAELGGGPMIEDRDDRGYVEPNPELYARLASLTQLTIDGLEERDILNSKNKDQLGKLNDMLIQLRDISVKELENTALTEEEYEFIRSYGGSLEHFWYETFTDEEKENPNLLNDNPAPVIADVATDPNCCVLEVGTGHAETIYVVFPIDGELRVGKGAVYSYYEFSWPMSDRLTDEKWRDEVLVDYENPPERPEWQMSYFKDFDE